MVFSDQKHHEEMVMRALLSLRFDNGDFEYGFEKITLSVSFADGHNSTELEIKLPPAPEIPGIYQSWQNKYSELVDTRVRTVLPSFSIGTDFYIDNSTRGFSEEKPTNFSFHECHEECNKYAEDLRAQVNKWLNVIKSELKTTFDYDTNSHILLTINTQNIRSQVTKDILHRLPWREWDYFNDNSALEAVLCLSESGSGLPVVIDDGRFRRVRITNIFGDSKNIDVAGDKELITKLQQRGAELINLEEPQRQDFIKLWDEPCDILFYSGHSESCIDGTVGSLQINSTESLNLQEIRNTFREAIAKGLRLAIFNSCDGLGLAKQLADLHLPYIIVWREPVPDKIAQKFLEYFLSSYAYGKSLFTSVRDARVKLVELTGNAEKENLIPGLNWLPIICKNTVDAPPTWKDLGGLTGKLPHCPYQGLSSFGEEDRDFFFGRDAVIADLVEAVNTKPLVPIIGASGSGKSSVVFAGLVPQLRDVGHVEIISFRPGKNPFDALAIAFNNYLQNNGSVDENNRPHQFNQTDKYNSQRLKELELRLNLERSQEALSELIKNIATTKNYSRFVLIADQFEEIYTLTDEDQGQPFLDTLLDAVRSTPAFSLVLTIRADFMGKILNYQPMGEAFQKYSPLLLTPMKREELQAVIEQPAAKMKVELEQGLTSKLINDLGSQPGRLPLLEFTLSQLWEKPSKWYLTYRAYEEIGGLEKALAKYASGVLNSLSAVDKEKAERIFIQLIRPGEGTEDTKRKATRAEVGKNNWDLVEFLANQRLVVTGWDNGSEQETVEIIHEALIRECKTLREWIQSNRQFRIWQERLQLAVFAWEGQNRSNQYLLRGGALVEAQNWFCDRKYQQYLSNSRIKFIQKSLEVRDREEQEKIQLQKRAIAWLSGGLIAASLATGLAGWNWIKAEKSATIIKIDKFRANSEEFFALEQYEYALIEAIKGNELLEKTLWRKSVPPSIEQKVKLVLYNAIHDSITIEKNTIANKSTEVNNSIITGHEDGARSVKFSPDGKTIVIASWDDTVQLRSASSGKLLHTLKRDKQGHKGLITSVEFSPDGKTIASASYDKTVKLWSANSGKLLHTITGHKDRVLKVKFSSDSKTIASASGDGIIKLWSANNYKLLHTLSEHKNWVENLEFSPDGQTIASASGDGTIKLWSANDGKLLHAITGHQDLITSIKFSRDSFTIASASRDKTVKLWSVENGKLLHTLSGHKDWVTSIAMGGQDNKTIASASRDKTVKLWSVENGRLLHTLSDQDGQSGHKDAVLSVKFSPDGKTIISASEDKTVKLWFVENGKLLYTSPVHQFWVNSIEFSSDSKTIASTSGDGTIKLWSISNAQLPPQTIKVHKNAVTKVDFSPDGKTIASVSKERNNNVVKLWSANSGKVLHTITGNKNLVLKVKLSKNGTTIASASDNGKIKLWSTNSSQLYQIIKAHEDLVTSIELSPDGETIASASDNGKIKLWSVNGGKLIHTLSKQSNQKDLVKRIKVTSIKFSPDGQIIASALGNGEIKLWSVNSGKILHTITGNKNLVKSMQLSRDGKTLAFASRDYTVKLWSANSDDKLLHTLSGHKDLVTSVVFSPDGETVASSSRDYTVKLWSVNSDDNDDKLLHTLSGHKDVVTSVVFSPDGKTIASTSKDKTVKLWLIDGKLLDTLSGHQFEVTSVAFSRDGNTIISTSDNGTIKLWKRNYNNLLPQGCNKLKDYLINNSKKLKEMKICQQFVRP